MSTLIFLIISGEYGLKNRRYRFMHCYQLVSFRDNIAVYFEFNLFFNSLMNYIML